MPITNKSDAFPDRAHDRSIKKIARNTWRYTEQDGSNVIRLHRTDVVREFADGRIQFNSGGYRSVTTKDRMNDNKLGYQVYSNKGIWYVRKGGWAENNAPTVPYYDGIILPDAFDTKDGQAESKRIAETALIKGINTFCRNVAKLDKLPAPSNGDCWSCSMFSAEPANDPGQRGKGWGHARENGQSGPALNDDHLRQHIRENYIHGSLIVNALRWAGWSDTSIGYALSGHASRSLVVSALRRYLKRKLGVG